MDHKNSDSDTCVEAFPDLEVYWLSTHQNFRRKFKRKKGIVVTHTSSMARKGEECQMGCLVIRKVANLEKEVLSEKNVPCTNKEAFGKENINSNKEVDRTESKDSLDKILVNPGWRGRNCKPIHWETIMEILGTTKKKKEEPMKMVKRGGTNVPSANEDGNLDQILVKHKSRIEKEEQGSMGRLKLRELHTATFL
ncbi:hypothetical protein CRYUN_Cryun06bG0057600 [Craigia yunnanensis]